MSDVVLDVTNDRVISGSNNAYGGGGRGVGVFDLNFASGDGPTTFIYTGAGRSAVGFGGRGGGGGLNITFLRPMLADAKTCVKH